MKSTAFVTAVALGCSLQLVVSGPLYAFGTLATQKSRPSLTIHPTTTVAIETANNTSASDSFSGQTNGNLAASNISKADTHTLLYVGTTTKIFAHFMPWFCLPQSDHCSCGTGQDGVFRCNGHILTQYNSNDATQVHRQVDDMVSRGLQGLVIDWYGSGHYIENETSKKIRSESETHTPAQFTFAIMDDGGQYAGCMQDFHCDVEAAIIADLTYAGNTFVPSHNYARATDGNPYLFFFDPDGEIRTLTNGQRSINWTRINNAVASFHFHFIFENTGGFTHSFTSGAYAWVQPTTNPDDSHWSTYLTDFYSHAKTYAPLHTFGGNFKGFDDHLAGWSKNRKINQHCGQIWQQTFDRINSAYSPATQLENIQLPTWNDYDEGTELESGIDNCVSVTAAVNNQTGFLSWTVTGDPSTLDHFTVFASADDSNLMVLQDDIQASLRTLDLSTYQLPANTYIRVKAVGKPMLLNHLSAGGVLYTGGAGGIQGQVLSAIDQHPLRGAAVSCSLGQRTTDANGYYVYATASPGTYTLTASLSGWLPNSVQVTVNTSMVTQNIPLATAGKVSGSVTKNGLPVSGATVTCSGGVIFTQQTYTTDSLGHYGSSWIPVGSYSCIARATGSAPQMKPMTITAGQTTILNFILMGSTTGG